MDFNVIIKSEPDEEDQSTDDFVINDAECNLFWDGLQSSLKFIDTTFPLSKIMRKSNRSFNNRLKIECFVCGDRTLNRSADKAFHHRKFHIKHYVQYFQKPDDNNVALTKGEFIMRFIVGFGERLIDEGYCVRSWKFIGNHLKGDSMEFARLELGLPNVVYYIDKPPFFVRTFHELTTSLQMKHETWDWSNVFFPSSRLLSYTDSLASRIGNISAIEHIAAFHQCERKLDTPKDLPCHCFYKDKNIVSCVHRNYKSRCLAPDCCKRSRANP